MASPQKSFLKEKTPLVVPREFLTGPVSDHDEYTPEQRRAIDLQLAESLEDARNGRVYDPFATAPELKRSLHRTARKAGAKARRFARR